MEDPRIKALDITHPTEEGLQKIINVLTELIETNPLKAFDQHCDDDGNYIVDQDCLDKMGVTWQQFEKSLNVHKAGIDYTKFCNFESEKKNDKVAVVHTKNSKSRNSSRNIKLFTQKLIKVEYD